MQVKTVQVKTLGRSAMAKQCWYARTPAEVAATLDSGARTLLAASDGVARGERSECAARGETEARVRAVPGPLLQLHAAPAGRRPSRVAGDQREDTRVRLLVLPLPRLIRLGHPPLPERRDPRLCVIKRRQNMSGLHISPPALVRVSCKDLGD